jgi:hypothetical protein
MDFQGPDAADLDNVYALNRAYLDGLSQPLAVAPGTASGTVGIIEKLTALSVRKSNWLSQCPFLIYSFPEAADRRWARLFSDDAQPDLFDATRLSPESVCGLAPATLGFLWELAKRNPYATRLVSGASLDWCERLAGSSPVRVFQFAIDEPGLLSPRLPSHREFWSKLLGAGTNNDKEIRHSAHLTALQTVLTKPAAEHYQRLPAAACLMPTPARRVAESDKGRPER